MNIYTDTVKAYRDMIVSLSKSRFTGILVYHCTPNAKCIEWR